MENASKALIIAGAILLAIVIISLGLVVINNVRSVTDDTNLSEQEIQAFNAKFVAYEGSIMGSKVNTLIQQVIATNQTTADNGENNFVCIAFPTISDSKKFFAVCYSTKAGKVGINYSGLKDLDANGKVTLTDVDDETNHDTIIGKRKDIIKGDGLSAAPGALSVDTGKKYTVKLTYHNGLVAGITVK